jgi:hypothetical protein
MWNTADKLPPLPHLILFTDGKDIWLGRFIKTPLAGFVTLVRKKKTTTMTYITDVTHWMPVPPIPQEKKAE